MSPLESLNLYVKAFFTLSPKQKDICRLLYSMEIGKRKEQLTAVFPSKRKIGNLVKCSTRTVKRFNSKVNGFLFDVIRRIDMSRKGRDTSNLYEMDNELFAAIHWLDKNNLLYASKRQALSRLQKVTISQGECQNLSPSPVRICPPIILNPLIKKKEEYKSRYIHPKIDKIKISQEAKIKLSRFPEHCIEKSIEDAVWFLKQGKEIKKPEGFMISRCMAWQRKCA